MPASCKRFTLFIIILFFVSTKTSLQRLFGFDEDKGMAGKKRESYNK